jgi:hypothetical protein
MSLKSRLDRLEQEATGDGRCPECRWRAHDVRTIYTSRHKDHYDPGEPLPPMIEVIAGAAADDQPGRPRCGTCGGYRPPIAFIHETDAGDVELGEVSA